ncbi:MULTISPECIES: bifunctional phosphopantothenoylcysteine decarboxylase/phosphopantothenate--cysteine ligase CoaBC [unclassified Paenibacillus]|uniref:bifunctional phosphopantothenoylcysteine decarboxylase/phosphopantothenate--cysteine ligase CoaBC n=1 Tax=Paenibacillus TaxID=44249 RepID=UPI000CFD60D5|nr:MULTISPECIES: bifunctional phosphopantothenoylcysteine decarboxylase/phosphopantothenate--cysteine ligase CoaBC [unclassified Paenibacillus]MDR6717952.1 phosphopantothenoylcysteine decarboxylase/phosphopantothenate--cysteine ligase [Paenibacillus sp. 2003]PRA05362.1 bifunctional phosphopantothenoylcysteine decarboxylase/phosphopantothenate--cysteine ligase CoaBC [Paenibacillus sp. MYb63]PRA50291.1 bifunctional phosphopantothenoylcysteine decarboxylase/phosphopantothenate--cysteine ligase CoaB
MLNGKKIVLGVTGGIAAYKAATLCSRLVQKGADVHVIMTASATQFITELTLQTLTRNTVYTDTFDEREPAVVSHIHLADLADLVLVAPATANVIAKMAHGMADDMLSTTLLATTAPVMIAPAMNVHMYDHPAVKHNMNLLVERGAMMIEPGEGLLACGYVGKGRLEEPESIVDVVERFFEQRESTDISRQGQAPLLHGKKVVVTAGGTIERIDPVRYITNDSSGKMGFAIAAAARDLGADVKLVMGSTQAKPPENVELIPVQSAQDMYEAVTREWDDADIVVKAAAVADYRPKEVYTEKIKKKGDTLSLELVKNIDILETLGQQKTHQFLIGFAAETQSVEMYAREKLERKNCDLIVANDVTRTGAGFGTDTNAVHIYDREGLVEELQVMAKDDVAHRLLRIAAERIAGRN